MKGIKPEPSDISSARCRPDPKKRDCAAEHGEPSGPGSTVRSGEAMLRESAGAGGGHGRGIQRPGPPRCKTRESSTKRKLVIAKLWPANPILHRPAATWVRLRRRRGAFAEASQHYEQALEIDPDLSEAHSNLGLILVSQHRFEKAREHYERAIALEGAGGNTRWNRGLLDLLQGKFEVGWQGYDSRILNPKVAPRSFAQPIWRGEPLHGARILLHHEQGMGDTLQFMRYAPLVHAAGGVVILDVKPPVVRLAKTTAGRRGDRNRRSASRVRVAVSADEPAARIQHDSGIDSGAGSVSAGAGVDARQKAAAIDLPEGILRVGFFSSGNPDFADDRQPSISASTFSPLFRNERVRFCSLQFGPAAAQLRELNAEIVDLGAARPRLCRHGGAHRTA